MLAMSEAPTPSSPLWQDGPSPLARLRIERRLTQQAVANRLGMSSNQVVSQWERGCNVPLPSNQQALAVLYGVPYEELHEAVMQTFPGRQSRYLTPLDMPTTARRAAKLRYLAEPQS